MIVTFHYFTNFLYDFIKKYINKRNSSRNNFTITDYNSDFHPLAQRDAENDIKFDPPVYKQRYERVADILQNEKWKNQISKLVDFGCAEFGFFVFLKNVVPVKEIMFVDIDEYLLRDYLYRVYPLNADHLVRRAQELRVKVFAGSVGDPDPNLSETDAVVAIELIEHLYPDVLEALPYNIFSYIKPKLAIFTTPNSEFNSLFTKMKKFRHADHKFEWTREQFESWAANLTVRFPDYTVQFDGVGLGPEDSEKLGCCSQLAVFIRKDIICDNYVDVVPCTCTDSTCKSLDLTNSHNCFCNCCDCLPKRSYGICTYNSLSKKCETDQNPYYKCMATINYPYEIDTRTEEEKFLDELKYRMHLLGHINGQYYNFETKRSEIPLARMVYQTAEVFPTAAELRDLLVKFNYQIEECINQETERIEPCVIYEPEMSQSSSGSDSEAASGYESDRKATDDSPLFDWDTNDMPPPWTCSRSPTTKDNETISENSKTQLRLEVGSVKGPLFDSGYQKSPSVPDESPQSVSEKPNKLSNVLSLFDNFDNVNELDAVRKEKKIFNFTTSNLPPQEMMKKLCQEIVRHPIAGPSRDPRRRQVKKPQSSDSDDSAEDVKSIATCILENSLNKIPLKPEDLQGALIQEMIPQPVPEAPPLPEPPVPVVENGDLANNNRDLEGNNYAAEEGEGEAQAVDNANLDNVVNIDNNNEVVDIEEEPEQQEAPLAENFDEEVDVEVAWSSREALFDVNSHVDLLEDFDMDPVESEAASDGVNMSDAATTVDEGACAVLPVAESSFPNWLLQIFEEGEALQHEDELHDEPHFYCQGDGLGVHPSTVALDDEEDDDDDDEGNESGTDSSSRSGSVDFASADNTNSTPDLLAVPEEARTDDAIVCVGHSVNASAQNTSVASSDHDIFNSAEDSESNLITSSCSQ